MSLAVREQPRNAQQLAVLLNFDYTAARHRLEGLNKLVQTMGEKYGKLCYASEVMELNWKVLEHILEKIRMIQR